MYYIYIYTYHIIHVGIKILNDEWNNGNKPDLIAPIEWHSPMALIKLPKHLQNSYYTGQNIQDELHYKYNIECPVKTINNQLYVRISAHIYNIEDDYKKLAIAVNKIK